MKYLKSLKVSAALFLMTASTMSAQGPCPLITDGSFESLQPGINCATLAGTSAPNYPFAAAYWFDPNGSSVGSPDIYASCAPGPFTGGGTTPGGSPGAYANSSVNSYNNSLTAGSCTMNGHTGSGYAGIYVHPGDVTSYIGGPANYREYLCQALTMPLVAGRTYNISMYVNLGCRSKFAVKNLQMFFSNGRPTQNGIQDGFWTPGTVVNFNNTGVINTTSTGWTLLSGSFVAPANYDWVSIGNCMSDANTTIQDLDPTNSWTYNQVPATGNKLRNSYYFIDDVSIQEAPIPVSISASNDCSTSLKVNFAPFYLGAQNATSYLWDFGDLSSSTAANPGHVYTTPGTYTVKLKITFPCQVVNVTKVITVSNFAITGNVKSLCNPATNNGIYSVPLLSSSSSFYWTVTATMGTSNFAVSYTNLNSNNSSIGIDWTPVLAQFTSLQAANPGSTPQVQICVYDNVCPTPRCITLSGCCGRPGGPSDGNNYYTFNNVTLVPVGTAGAQVFSNSVPNQTVFSGNVACSGVNAYINVLGNLIVNNNSTLSGVWQFNEGSAMYVNSAKVVSINGADMRGCVSMWNGIVNNGDLSIVNSQIHDAVVAVYNGPQASSQLKVTGSLFNRNKTSIQLNQMPVTSSNFYIKKSIFSCRDFGFPYDAIYQTVMYQMAASNLGPAIGPNVESNYTAVNMKGSALLGIPANQLPSSYGINVSNIPAANTFNMSNLMTAEKNYFDNHEIGGIYLRNSRAVIANNDFKNMSSTNANYATGIIIANSSVKPIITIGNSLRNNFKNLNNGITATGEAKLMVYKNRFDFISNKGVTVTKWYASNPTVNTVYVDQNIFNQCLYDIYATDNYNVNAYLQFSTSTGVALNGPNSTNIYVDELTKPKTAKYTILGNTLSNYINGIHCMNVYGASITYNTVTLGRRTPNTGNAAIWLENTDQSLIRKNTINVNTAMTQPDLNTSGILTSIGVNNMYLCNDIKSTGVCMKFKGSSPSNIFKNSFNDQAAPVWYGIYLDNSGYTGQIAVNTPFWYVYASAENIFGNFNNRDTRVQSGIGSNIYYTGPAVNTNNLCPYWNSANTNLTPYTPIQTTLTGGINCDDGSSLPYTVKDPKGPRLRVFYQDGLDFGSNTISTMAIARKAIYNVLKDTPPDSLEADDNDFILSSSQTNIGRFEEIDNLVYSSINNNDAALLASAQSLNTTVIPENDVENNQVAFNAIFHLYLRPDSSITPTEINALTQLAQKCPFTDGAAVYQARALLKKYDPTDYFNACELYNTTTEDNTSTARLAGQSETSGLENNEALLTKVFPNPSSGLLNVSTTAENASICIYNLLGEIMINQPIGQLTNINTQNLANGTYIYKIISDNQILKTDKLIIQK